MTALSPPGIEDRQNCEEEGLFEELRDKPCKYRMPVCEHCGKAPECAKDCSGMAAILSSDQVHVIGNEKLN